MTSNAIGFFDPTLARQSLRPLAKGLVITIELTFIVIAISLVAGILIALARRSTFWPLRLVIGFYVEIFRSTPLLIQLIFIYFSLPFAGITLPAFTAGVIGLSLNYTAYLSEVFRGGIQAVPRGQTDAARALGMRNRTLMAKIILPQAIRIVIPTLGNYFVSLFKDTSLVSVITIQELLFSGQIIADRTFNYSTVYTMVFLYYAVVSYPAILFVRYLERRVSSGYTARQQRATEARLTPTTLAEGKVL